MMKLTDDQKMQIKMARRAQARMAETWSLFTMYLGEGKTSKDAMRLAREAVEVWVTFEDETNIDPPEIEIPSLEDQLGPVFERMRKVMPDGVAKLNIDKSGAITGADFVHDDPLQEPTVNQVGAIDSEGGESD